MEKSISIIIPTYRESQSIGSLVAHLQEHDNGCIREIIVADAGSEDGTVTKALEAGAQVVVSEKGRARQLNAGARKATGKILYFLHADAFPPASYCSDIVRAINQGFDFGHFRQYILSKNRWVKINSFLSGFNGLIASGGDQSLFMRRNFFEKLGGFKDDLLLMEDYDLVKRARSQGRYTKIPKSLQVLDRKYRYNSFFRVNFSNAVIFSLYRLGVHPNKLYPIYKSWIKGPRYRTLEAGKD